MYHGQHRFAALNMSGPRVRQMFVFLLLGTAIIFIFTGFFAMIRAKQSSRSSDIGRFTSGLSAETMVEVLAREIPYLRSSVQIPQKEGMASRLTFELATSIDPRDPRTFLGRELPGFALFDTEIVVAGQGVDYTDIPVESAPPPDLEEKLANDVEPSENSEESKDSREKQAAGGKEITKTKRVFIYHTHSTESYLPELSGEKSPERAYDNRKNIMMVGRRLGEELENMGIGAEVYTKPFQAKWNRLYQASRKTVVEAMNQNGDLKYFIDVHRDSKRRNKTTHHINGKPYATIAFVVGTANDNWEENEKFARQVHNKLEELYPGLSKGVFRKSRAQGNGEYNQSLSPRSILVEIGGVDNTFEEAYRTAEALARAIAEIHFEATPVDAKPQNP